MALLKEEFESSGNWLFRWRSYLPLFMIGICLLALREYVHPRPGENLSHAWVALCLMISFFGLGIRVFTIGYTPKGTSGRNTKKQIANDLNTSGIYSVVRNPLYLGNFFMGLGISLFAGLWWLALIYTLIFWLYYERIIFAEEAYLRNKFGSAYLGWANVTPVFIPKLNQYKKADLPFSIKNVLKREYNGFFAVVLAMFFLEVMRNIFSMGSFNFNLEWLWLLGISFALWIVLRSLKKYTRLLNVAGR